MHARTVALTLACLTAPSFAGPLNPPAGPIASTYRTLSEVEPRTPISLATTPGDADSLFRITQPGSYYLTGHVTGVAGKHGIQVEANDVTIDFMGFVLQGVGGAKAGIADHNDEMQPSVQNLTVRNGTITGFPHGGIDTFLTSSGRLERMSFRANGSYGVAWNGALIAADCEFIGQANGIGLQNQGSGVVTGCIASGNGTGFLVMDTVLENCTAEHNTSTGFMGSGSLFRACRSVGNPVGISANGRTIVDRCIVSSGATGIETTGLRDTIRECSVSSVSGDGILVELGSTSIFGNTMTACNVGLRINAFTTNSHVEGNVGSDNTFGIIVNGTENRIFRNAFGRTPGANTTYQIAAGNRFGSIVKVNSSASSVVAAGVTGTIAGTISTLNDPFANFNF